MLITRAWFEGRFPAVGTGLFLALLCVCTVPAAGELRGTIGMNKFDLALQYLGTASRGDGSDRYRKVTEAMARKALYDARYAGIRYFRISPAGYGPSEPGQRGDLDLWRSDRAAYWGHLDRMMTELAEHGIRVIPAFVWNSRQFPAMTSETVRDLLTNPQSKAYRMLDEYISEFVTRYRSSDVLLFYEVGNELNLQADIDVVAKCHKVWGASACSAEGNFTTDEMVAFTRRLAERLRALDPGRLVSSGHSFPRPSASHLRRRPEFAPGGADWTHDSAEELAQYIEATHAGLDIVSVHVYEEHPLPSFMPADHAKMIAFAGGVARRAGKPLFVGEIGGPSRDGLAPGSFLERALTAIKANAVPYTALWIWQYYQNSTYRSFDSEPTRYNIEPGFSNGLLRRVMHMNKVSSLPRAAADRTRPNVVITWPMECASLVPPFDVYVAASDDSGKQPRVRVHAGGRIFDAGNKPPYAARIDALLPGEHELRADAADGAGNRASWSTPVLVSGFAGGPVRCVRCCAQ